MVYVVSLTNLVPPTTQLEVFEFYLDALQRAAIWAGMNEHKALHSNIKELEDFIKQCSVCTIQEADFYPKLPLCELEQNCARKAKENLN